MKDRVTEGRQAANFFIICLIVFCFAAVWYVALTKGCDSAFNHERIMQEKQQEGVGK